MLIASVISISVILLLVGGGIFGPPHTKAAAVRIRIDNRRDNLPVENSNKAVWLLIGDAVLLALIFLINSNF